MTDKIEIREGGGKRKEEEGGAGGGGGRGIGVREVPQRGNQSPPLILFESALLLRCFHALQPFSFLFPHLHSISLLNSQTWPLLWPPFFERICLNIWGWGLAVLA